MAGKHQRKGDKHARHLAKRTQRASRKGSREKVDRRRSIVVDATGMGGVEFDEPHIMVVIEPIQMPSGDHVYFQTPFVVPFYLLKAKALRDAAEPKRKRALKNLTREQDGTFRPNDAFAVLDALEDLSLSVILSAAAIEAHANDMIGRLPDHAMVEIPTRVGGERIAVMRDKAAMDWLPISDKIARATPLLHGTESIKGTVAWQKYRKLFRVRDRLMHQRREAHNDPSKPSAFGQLLLGELSSAPEDAASIIEAMEPGWMPKEARKELGLPAES